MCGMHTVVFIGYFRSEVASPHTHCGGATAFRGFLEAMTFCVHTCLCVCLFWLCVCVREQLLCMGVEYG